LGSCESEDNSRTSVSACEALPGVSRSQFGLFRVGRSKPRDVAASLSLRVCGAVLWLVFDVE